MELTIGIVKDNADPMQDGRLRVFVPALDSSSSTLDQLPWCKYVTPFGGHTADYTVGRDETKISGITSYGLWAIPKNGAQVLIACIDNDPQRRVWLGCLYQQNLTRTIPQSENPIKTEIDESGNYNQSTISHYETNLNEAGLGVGSSHFNTRGGYERSVSYPQNGDQPKPTTDGYASKPLEPDKADSQTIALKSPGGHYMTLSDVKEHCRIRFKTISGNQILLDDTNERIYISTAKGRNWVELDETTGKIYIYSDSKINIRGKNDINLYSDENINIVAKKRVNIKSETRGIFLQSKNNIQLLSSGGNINSTASRSIILKTTNGAKESAIAESTSYEFPGKGNIHNYGETGGDSNSGIFIDASDGVDIRGNSQDVKISSSQTLHLKSDGSSVQINGSSGSFINATTPGSVINSSASSASPAQSIEPIDIDMIRPDKESWERDEDESKNSTKRNKYWKK